MHELEAEKDVVRNDREKHAVLFKEMVQMCLWCVMSLLIGDRTDVERRGNATVCHTVTFTDCGVQDITGLIVTNTPIAR